MCEEGAWCVYIIECADGSYYTGITNHLNARIEAHNAGTGARYTKGRGPVTLRYSETYADRSKASMREYAIKQLSRHEKARLMQG